MVGGVSAGANLALGAALTVGAERGIALSVLFEVPAVDLRDAGTWLPEYAEVNALPSTADLRARYAPGADPADPRISPALDPRLRFVQRAHVMTAEYDPLRGGGELLANRLRAAGVPVGGGRHPRMLHGAPGLTRRLPAARAWHAEAAAALRVLTSAR